MGEPPAEYRDLQVLLDRHRDGVQGARERLVEWADRWGRPRVRAILLQKFPELARWEEVEDLHNEVLRRVNNALMSEYPATPGKFLGLVTRHMYFHLSDRFWHYFGPEGLGRHYRSPPKSGSGRGRPDAWLVGADHDNPARRAEAAEREAKLRQSVDQLNEMERDVVLLHAYQELPHDEIADLLEVSRSTVARAWAAARLNLGKSVE